MNLKGFKKTHEDEYSATLQNQRGHSIKLAKAQLSKSHCEALEKLPLYAAEGEQVPKKSVYAEQADQTMGPGNNQGIADEQQYEKEMADKSDKPNQPQEWQSAKELAQQEKVRNTMSQAPSPQEAPQDNSAQPALGPVPSGSQYGAGLQANPALPTDQGAQPMPDIQPQMKPASAVAPAAPIPTARPIPPKVDYPTEVGIEGQKFDQDQLMGHIRPKTYADLMFNDKSLPGKFMSVFGMALSGLGSGMSGQPNMYMQMMDNMINRDLESQKSSAENAQNALKINQAHQLNLANIKHLRSQGLLNEAQAVNQIADANLKGLDAAKMQYGLTLLNGTQQDFVDRMPPGPQRDQAQQLLNGIKATHVANVQVRAQKTNQQLHSNKPGGIDYNRLNGLQFSGVAPPADVEKMTQEAKQIGDVNLIKSDFLNAYDKVDKMLLAGTFSPHLRDALTEPLIAKATKLGEGRYTEAANHAYKAMLPQKGDSPNTRMQKRIQAERFFGDLAGSTPTLERYQVINKPQGQQAQQPQQQEQQIPSGMKKQVNKKTGETRLVPR